MKCIFLIVLIVLFVALVLIYPFKLKGALHADLVNNVAFVVIKVFDIKLHSSKVQISDGKIKIDKKKKKNKHKDKKLHHYYFMSLIKKVNVKKLEVMLDVGFKNNPYLTSMLCGGISLLISCLSVIILELYGSNRVFESVQPHYDYNIFELSGELVVSFTLLDMFISIISAIINKRKEKVNG